MIFVYDAVASQAKAKVGIHARLGTPPRWWLVGWRVNVRTQQSPMVFLALEYFTLRRCLTVGMGKAAIV